MVFKFALRGLCLAFCARQVLSLPRMIVEREYKGHYLDKHQIQALPPMNFPPITIPGIPSPLHITVPDNVTIGKKIIPDSDHPFRAPGPGDQRGGCPGLNILANYGYINRTGITNVGELLYATQEMLAFAPDLASILVAVSVRAMLDPTTLKMSIGLTDTRTNGPLSYLFGQAPGPFSPATHTKYEVDGSLAYTDEFFAPGHVGNQFNSTLWATNVAIAKANKGLFDIVFNGDARYAAYKRCISTNPQCSWLAVEQLLFYGAETFTFLTMPSAGADGKPEPATINAVNSFMGAHDNEDGTYTKVPGRLPPGSTGPWYRRSIPLTVAEVIVAAIASYGQHPVAFGTNTNGINTFVISGPQLNGNLTAEHVICLIINTIIEETPSVAGSVVNVLAASTRTSFDC